MTTGRRSPLVSPATVVGAASGAVIVLLSATMLLCAWGATATATAASPSTPTANRSLPPEPPLTLENARPANIPPPPRLGAPRAPAAPPPLYAPDMLDVPDPTRVETRAPLPAPAATPGLPPVPARDKQTPPTPAPAPAPVQAAAPATPPAKPAAAPAAVAAPPKTAAVALPPRPWQVAFPVGSSSLPQDAMGLLSSLADVLTAYPNRRLKLLAYAPGDSDHQREARQLSLARALAVREKLSGLGIRATRIDLHPLGAAVPADATVTPDRVDLEWATE